MTTRRDILGIAASAMLLVPLGSGEALAASFTDFSPLGFVPDNSVHNLQPDGTPAAPPISATNPDVQAWSVRQAGVDEEVEDISGDDPIHGKVWRLSDQTNTGNLQLRPHAPNSGEFSGESTAIDDFGSQTPTTDRFFASLDFRSANGAAQQGMQLDVTAACGDDCRHGFVRIIDDGTGFDLRFFETGDNSSTNSCSSFVGTDLDLNLSYDEWHNLGIEIHFVDGFGPGGVGVEGNDVVNILVDGQVVHTGTSWETCYAFVGGGQPRGVDRLAFSRATTALSAIGGGLYFDNVLVTDENPNPVMMPPDGVAELDHFQCYTAVADDRAAASSLSLEDQFGLTPNARLRSSRSRTLCAPVDKNGEGIGNPETYLVCHNISTNANPRETVVVTNQFGEEELLVLNAQTLCLPSTKQHLAE